MLVKHAWAWVSIGMWIATFLFLTGFIIMPAALQIMETWHSHNTKENLSNALICNENECIGPGD
jgi:hypothetical protein